MSKSKMTKTKATLTTNPAFSSAAGRIPRPLGGSSPVEPKLRDRLPRSLPFCTRAMARRQSRRPR